MKNYVGRKIRGFRFEDGTDGIAWAEDKASYIGKVGLIIMEAHKYVVAEFEDDNTWSYPISLIEPHLIEEENNASLVKCGYCNNHYRCTTCGAICGTEGHYVEKEPHLIEEEAPEIPQLGEGVLMEVSDDGEDWAPRKVVGQLQNGDFVTASVTWKKARAIPQLPKYTHAELVEKLGEDFIYEK
jgi:hypothetical protein